MQRFDRDCRDCRETFRDEHTVHRGQASAILWRAPSVHDVSAARDHIGQAGTLTGSNVNGQGNAAVRHFFIRIMPPRSPVAEGTRLSQPSPAFVRSTWSDQSDPITWCRAAAIVLKFFWALDALTLASDP